MPSPSTAGTITNVANSSQLIINALLAGMKWGGALGTGATLTYSFPWAASDSATFLGPTGSSSDYSTAQEFEAPQHYGFNAIQQAAATAALQTWASVANVTFTTTADTGASVGDVRFAWSSALPSEAAAWAGYPDNVFPSGGDIWFNAGLASVVNGGWNAGDYDFYSLIHEIGHALGLKHSFSDTPVLTGAQDTRQYTVMSYTDGAHSLFGSIIASGNSETYHLQSIVPETPMVDDIAAIQYLYGANTSYRTGNDTYTFDPASPFMRTIWDAGGADTISVSNFTKGCIIDLQPGHYSKITIESASTDGFNFSGGDLPNYDGTDNLGIAFGCIIENAIGGSGNDTLIGNDANNSLAGGAGNDTLDGGAGTDTAVFSGLAGAATLTYNAATRKVTVVTAGGGTDILGNIEFASFSDKTVDLSTLGGVGDDYTATTATAGKLVVGASATGSVETAGDTDWFAVTLAAGATYRFDLAPVTGSALTSQVRIYGGSGSLLATGTSAAGGASQLSYKASTAGTYYVSAGGTSNSTGSYSVAATLTVAADDYTATTATGGRLAVGSSATGSVETSGDADWFAITLAANTTYRFDVAPAGASTLSPQVKIYNSAGQLQASGTAAGGASQLSYKTTTAGTYYVAASAATGVATGAATGAYSVAAALVATDDYTATSATTGKVTVGASATGNVETPGDADWFAVTLTAGATYTITLNAAGGSQLDPLLRLYNSAGALQATDDNGGGGGNGSLTYKATATGTYYVSAAAADSGNGASTGAYSVAVAQVVIADDYTATTATTGKLAIGSSATGTVETSGDSDWFAVTLAAGTSYRFDLAPAQGSQLSSQIKIFNSAGTVLATGAAGTGGTSQLTYKATTAGTYYVSAGAGNTSTGAYALAAAVQVTDDFSATTATNGKVTVGGATAGTIESAGDADWFAVTLTAGATYTIEVKGAAGSLVDPLLRLYNNAATLLDTNDDGGGGLNARLSFKAAAGGTYYIAASGANNTLGAYTVSVANGDTAAPELVSVFPDDGATGVTLNANLTATFNEAVKRGSGNVQLLLDDGTVVESFNVATSPRIAINGATVTIDPTVPLKVGTHYRLLTPAGAITDLTGNGIAGIDGYDFTTRGAPSNQPGTYAGTAGSDDVLAGSGNDTLAGSAGNDLFDGGAGLDTVRYQGARAAFTAQAEGGGAAMVVTVDKGAAGKDVLTNVERLLFNDGAMAFDTGAGGIAGQAYRMYQAAFDRTPDATGLGFWISMMDNGVTRQDVAAAFVNSPEFQQLYGASPTNEELVTRMYKNVLHRAPDSGGIAFWLNVLDNKLATVPAVLAAFSESPENQDNMVAVIGSGFGYQPYGG